MSHRNFLLSFALFSLSFGSQVFAQDSEVKLTPGQSFTLRIMGVPADEAAVLSGIYTVGDNGNIRLHLMSEIKAAGLTPSELSRKIESVYKSSEIYTRPTITIMAGGGAAGQGGQHWVTVTGEVKQQQRVAFSPNLTMLDAITSCGGFSDFASAKKVKLVRNGNTTFHDLRKLESKDNIVLLPDDRIFVDKGGIFN